MQKMPKNILKKYDILGQKSLEKAAKSEYNEVNIAVL